MSCDFSGVAAMFTRLSAHHQKLRDTDSALAVALVPFLSQSLIVVASDYHTRFKNVLFALNGLLDRIDSFKACVVGHLSTFSTQLFLCRCELPFLVSKV